LSRRDSSFSEYSLQAFFSYVQISLSRALCFLFERMQDVYTFGKLRDVEDAMLNIGTNSKARTRLTY